MLNSKVPTFGVEKGSVPLMIQKTINFNTSGIASGVNWFKIEASTAKPVLVEFFVEVVTAFNAASTNVLTAGRSTDSGFDDIITAAMVTEATPGFYPASNANVLVRFTSDTLIKVSYTQTGTAATTGQAIFYARITPFAPTVSVRS